MRLTKDNLMYCMKCLMAGAALLAIQPYLVWETYSLGRFFDMLRGAMEIAILLLYLFRRTVKLDKTSQLMIPTFLVMYLYHSLNTYDGKVSIMGVLGAGVTISIFLALSNADKRDVFLLFKKLFAIAIIPGIFFLLCRIVGIDLPHDYIKPIQEIKVYNNLQYRHYFGCVFRENPYNPFNAMQLCGMFDEPGTVGTLGALLLCGDQYRMKGHYDNIIIFIAGCMSVSLAFVVLSLFYFVARMISSWDGKKMLIFLAEIASFVLILFILSKIPLFKVNVIERLLPERLLNNNRTTDEFEKIFAQFIKGPNILFGLGNHNPIFSYVDAASYKVLIFNTGIVGFVLNIGWFLFWGIKCSNMKMRALIFAMAFMLSVYQRPWIVSLYHIIIYIGGIMNSKLEDKPEIQKAG